MNIQAMMKQAQKLQKEMIETKGKIEEMEFTGKSSFVTVTLMGNKEIKKVNIDIKEISNDEIEMLEDMILVATNDALKQVDEIMDKEMGKYTQGMPGLF